MKNEELRMNIPEHWEVVKSADILDIRDGTHDTPKYITTNGIPLITSKNLKENKIDFQNIKYISKYDHDEISNRSKVEEGDILFAMIGTIGNPVVIKGDANFSIKNVGLFKKNYSTILPSFLVNFLRSSIFEKQLITRKFLKGTTQKFIPLGNLRNIHIPLPPLHEQASIVAKIEELLSDLENGKQQLLIAKQQLKVYRQSLLKAAFEGRLTENEELKIKNEGRGNDELKIKNEKLESSDKENLNDQTNHKNHSADNLPEGWKWVKSGELFEFVTSGSRGWAKFYSDKGAIFIRITNLDFDSLDLDLEESKIQYVNPPTNSEGIRTKVKEGDFLFSITGYLGMFAIAPKLENAYVNQHVCLCRPKNGFIKKYVGYWIISKSGGHHYLNINQKGAVKAGLTLDDIKNFPIPLPPLPVQEQIVSILESKLTVCDKLEETITNSLEQAETLRQSILKKAFEGRLV